MVNGFLCADMHCHIYPEAIVERAVDGTGKFYDLPLLYRGTADDLKTQMYANGVDLAVVQSVASTPKQVKSINEFIAKTVENDPVLIGLGTLHPDSEELADDFKHLLELGLRGVKLHPDMQRFPADGEKCAAICRLCATHGLPLLIHCGDFRYDFSNPNRMANLLRQFPTLTVIGAHFGGWSVWDDAVSTLPAYKNFCVDCSSSFHWLGKTRAIEIIRHYGADRVLFGTDYPMWDIKKELDFLLSMPLDESEKKSILYYNTAKIFRLGGTENG